MQSLYGRGVYRYVMYPVDNNRYIVRKIKGTIRVKKVKIESWLIPWEYYYFYSQLIYLFTYRSLSFSWFQLAVSCQRDKNLAIFAPHFIPVVHEIPT